VEKIRGQLVPQTPPPTTGEKKSFYQKKKTQLLKYKMHRGIFRKGWEIEAEV
jgi:hypothetical protein